MKRLSGWMGAGLMALLFVSSCDLSEDTEPVRYISLLAPDTLLSFDTVMVMAMAPARDSVLDTLWNAPLKRIDELAKLPAGHYHGGAVDVLILGVRDGWAGYSLKVEYRGSSKPRLEASPPWDTVPPLLVLKGPDSAGFREGQAMPDTGAECADEHPGAPRLTVTGQADPFRAGTYELQYACRDRAGNVSRRYQRFFVSRWPDTLAPELRHPADSLVTLAPGTDLEQKDIACVDDRDNGLSPIRTGALDTGAPGLYHLTYHCADSEGNQSPDWILKVRVLPWPDHVPPQIALAGPDTVSIFEGSAFDDPGAKCHDGQEDGVHESDPDSVQVVRQGSVDPKRRGIYPLIYQCSDHAGNTAFAHRWVVVARVPDSLPPVLRLKGPDSVEVFDHEPYADSGAVCADARDGALGVAVAGEVAVAARGRYELRYTCADTAGNGAEAIRVVRVVRRPDGTKPVLTLAGADSLDTFDHEPFADPGAACRDDRDGPLPVTQAGAVDPAVRGRYVLRYACADTAGNGAEAIRVVRVVRRPDGTKPVLTLVGADSLDTFDHEPYADLGAACRDDRDGPLPVTQAGAVDPAVRGRYVLRYACADSAGNAAEAIRVVRVVRRPDAVAPALTLKGPDTLVVYDHQAFADPGANCVDDRDGALPFSVTGGVDTAIRGAYPLAYGCADSAGNAAAKTRLVRVMRMPDSTRPMLALKGPDSLDTWEGRPYIDSGASCVDDRDGTRPVAVTGAIDTGIRGLQTLRFACADSVGNAAAERVRKVRVIRVPDPVKPVVTLLGPPSPTIPQGDPYADAGATCLDDRDGNLPVTRLGTVDPSRLGIYPLKYTCADSAGNLADTVTRTVTVAIPSDIVKPVLTLRGPDTIPVLTLSHFDEPGATCTDDRDGTLTPVFAGFGSPDGPPSATGDGVYHARYTCTDKSGNVAEAFRTVKAGLYTTNLMATQDASIDTTTTMYNNGYTGISAITQAVGDPYVSLFRFDLSKVVKTGLKTAKVRFVVWAREPLWRWPGTAQDYSIQLWAVKRAWVEGTGNWFFHRGDWQNSGAAWFADYFVVDTIKAKSSDPADRDGITGADRDMFRRSNATLAASQTVNIRFPNAYTTLMAPPKDLRVIEIDVTNYVKNTDPDQAFGFFPVSDNEPTYIGIINRELNGGEYAPRLMLSY